MDKTLGRIWFGNGDDEWGRTGKEEMMAALPIEDTISSGDEKGPEKRGLSDKLMLKIAEGMKKGVENGVGAVSNYQRKRKRSPSSESSVESSDSSKSSTDSSAPSSPLPPLPSKKEWKRLLTALNNDSRTPNKAHAKTKNSKSVKKKSKQMNQASEYGRKGYKRSDKELKRSDERKEKRRK